MLKLGRPYRRKEEDRELLCAIVTVAGKDEEVRFSVEAEYGEYLTDDRADAFLVGFLTTAMRMGEDIACEAPVSRRLYYQITQYLIPTLTANMKIYHPITIHAAVTDEILSCKGAVGTGWTGGVDSMYTLMTHALREEAGYRLTHLLCANNGALEGEENTELLRYMAEKARNGIAKELGLSVVSVDTNLQLLQDEAYLAVAAFRLPAVVLALQKLFGVFLNSAGYEFSRFSYVEENSAYYELVPLSCFETDTTVFYSAGGQISRLQKLKELSGYAPATRYLHPCIYVKREGNCGKCGKCIRTMGALDAIDALNAFREVFDVEEFYRNREEILAKIVSKKESQHYGEVLHAMKQNGKDLSPEVLRKSRIMRAAAAVMRKSEERSGKEQEGE